MTARVPDSNDWYEIKDNPLSKVGVFSYSGASIDSNGEMGLDPKGIYSVYRPAKELSDPETIESFKLLPWIDDHELLGNEDAGLTPADEKGVKGVVGQDVYFQDGFLRGNIKLFSEDLANAIEAGKSELSCGYKCAYHLEEGIFGDQKYQVVQTKIRGNHLASVDEGRMGPEVAVLDHLTFTIDSKDFKRMPKAKAKKDKKAPSLKELLAVGEDSLELPKIVLALANSMSSMQTAMDTMMEKSEDEEEEEKKGEDEEEEKEKKGEDGEHKYRNIGEDEEKEEKEEKKGEDEEEEKEKSSGSDAALKTIRSDMGKLKTEFAAHKKAGIKSLFREMQSRDALYEKVSPAIGAFDHSKMTAEELAVYACDKLDLDPPKGHEVTAIDSYFTNRRPQMAFDARIPGTLGTPQVGSKKVNSYFNPEAN